MMCGVVSGRRPLRLSRHGPRPLRPWIPPMQFILSFLQHLSRERKTSAVAQSRRTTGAPRRDSGRREGGPRRGSGSASERGGASAERAPPRERELFRGGIERGPETDNVGAGLGRRRGAVESRALSSSAQGRSICWGRVALAAWSLLANGWGRITRRRE